MASVLNPLRTPFALQSQLTRFRPFLDRVLVQRAVAEAVCKLLSASVALCADTHSVILILIESALRMQIRPVMRRRICQFPCALTSAQSNALVAAQVLSLQRAVQ